MICIYEHDYLCIFRCLFKFKPATVSWAFWWYRFCSRPVWWEFLPTWSDFSWSPGQPAMVKCQVISLGVSLTRLNGAIKASLGGPHKTSGWIWAKKPPGTCRDPHISCPTIPGTPGLPCKSDPDISSRAAWCLVLGIDSNLPLLELRLSEQLV